MPSLSPDERAWPPVHKAGWLQQTFVHWPFRPADVQVLLPRGLLVDEYDGMAWVSFTPFLMAGLRPAAVPIEPRITTFPETNLRTYVRRPNGRDGIWFLSLEVGSAAMLAARCAPYYLGDLSVSEHGGAVWCAGADVPATRPTTHSPARRSDPALPPGHLAHRPMARLHPSLGIMPRPRALVGVVLPNPTNAGGGPAPRKSTS